MRFPLGRSKKTVHDIVIDIGSGSVGVGVMEQSQTEPRPTLIFTYRERLRLAAQHDEATHLRAVREALFSATLALTERGVRPLVRERRIETIRSIRVLASAPWTHTLTRTISCVDSEPLRVTDKIIKDLLEKGDVPSPEHSSLDLRLVKKSLLEVRLNGYLVADVLGQLASEIALTVAHEHVPALISKTIDEVEANLTPHQNAEERTHAFALYTALKALYPGERDLLVLDVTGEASEALVIRDGVLKDTFVLARGSHTLVRDLATAMGTIPAEAETHLKDTPVGTGAAGQQYATFVDTAAGHYRELLQKIREHHTLPHRVFFIADFTFSRAVQDILTRAFTAVPNARLIPLDKQLLEHVVSFGPQVPHDAMLGIAAAFFHTEDTHHDRGLF